MNLYLHLKQLFRTLSNCFLPQAEQRVILFTTERCHTVNISSKHLTYRVLGQKAPGHISPTKTPQDKNTPRQEQYEGKEAELTCRYI